MKLTYTLATALVGLALASPGPVAAGYPDRPITLIIGFAPGGPTDAIGRVLFKTVSQKLGTPIVIENHAGAGGNIGSQDLIRAKPDGYTLLYGTSSITSAAALYGRQDLNPETAFAVAGCSVSVPLILLASNKVGIDSAPAFYAAMKASPGKYFMGSSGNGSIDHLVAMDLAGKLDVKFQHVPYKGNGPALTDVVAGTTNFMYSGSFNSAIPFIKSGQVKALGVTSSKRSQSLPNVPTLSESVPGLQGYDAGTWQVLLAPKGTPSAILDKLNGAMQSALQDPEVMASMRFQGAEPMDKNLAQCQQYIDTEYERWSGIVERLGLKAQ